MLFGISHIFLFKQKILVKNNSLFQKKKNKGKVFEKKIEEFYNTYIVFFTNKKKKKKKKKVKVERVCEFAC